MKEHVFKQSYAIDSEAAAVVLNETSNVYISKDQSGGYSYYTQEHRVYRMIKILKQPALHLANVHLYLSGNSKENYVSELIGKVYNADSGKVVMTELNDVYRKKVRANFAELSFSLPGVKEGCVIVYSYTIVSPVKTLLPEWEVQEEYPKLFTSYKVNYPGRFEYTSITHFRGNMKTFATDREAINSNEELCFVSSTSNIYDASLVSFWLRRNVKAIKKEPYVQNMSNNSENMMLQLTGYRGLHSSNTWESLNKEFMDDKYVRAVSADNTYMDVITDSIKKANKEQPDNAVKGIYQYVRNNFTVKGSRSNLTTNSNLYDVFKNKTGTVTEINILLCAMLVHGGWKASPLLIGTTSNISPTKIFPAIDRFNYMACAVNIDSSYILLDASKKYTAFGLLPRSCYNGYARVINDNGGGGLMLTTDMISNKTLVTVKIGFTSDSAATIEVMQKHGMMMSAMLREKWYGDKEAAGKHLQSLLQTMPADYTFDDSKVHFEKEADTNIVITMKGQIKLDKNASNYYLSSNILNGLSENPFKQTIRTLPIEFPYQSQYQYYMTIELPARLVPEELPQPVLVSLGSADAMRFKKNYSYHPEMNKLIVNSSFNVNTTTYATEEYEAIRSFYQQMIKQENELLVIAKKD